jgi:hypothetical protein
MNMVIGIDPGDDGHRGRSRGRRRHHHHQMMEIVVTVMLMEIVGTGGIVTIVTITGSG